jgi:hypothetical protein
MTTVNQATELARQWVAEECRGIPGFVGAFSHGSMNWLPGDTPLSATSDVDIMTVLEDPALARKKGKLLYRGVLLEASYLAAGQLQSAEDILAQHQIAGSFRTARILADPAGRLAGLQARVAEGYAQRYWVERRCASARARVEHSNPNEADPFDDQVVAWLFPAGITTHILLVAGLKNPTVRQRYVAVRRLLEEYGHLGLYPELLELLRCTGLSRDRVQHHLDRLGEVFDTAARVIKTPFFFAADISELARPIAIGGSQELIDRGDHREAIFWMVATACRCQKVLAADAPELQEQYQPDFRALVADLGIHSFADIQRGRQQTLDLLPRIWDVAQAIIAANPEIVDDGP